MVTRDESLYIAKEGQRHHFVYQGQGPLKFALKGFEAFHSRVVLNVYLYRLLWPATAILNKLIFSGTCRWNTIETNEGINLNKTFIVNCP